MDEQGIEIANLPLLPVIRRKWQIMVVGLVEARVKASKERGHRQVHAAMSIIYCRVDQHRLAVGVAEEVAAKKTPRASWPKAHNNGLPQTG